MDNQPVEGVEFPAEDSPAEAQWYVAIGSEVYGPAAKATLAQWAVEGRVIPGAHVLRVGDQEWVPIHTVAELSDIRLTAPPPPAPPAYAPMRAPVPQRRLCSCPHCGGPVQNVAPAYGWPYGLFQRSLKPEFRCAQCGRKIEFEELTPVAQAQVSRGVRMGTIAWFGIVIGLILVIALCVFVCIAVSH
jgi:hypothetical protein